MDHVNHYGDEKIERYLNELSAEYKELLLKSLLEQSPSVEDLSVSDLMRLDQEIKKPLLTDYRRYVKRRRRMLLWGAVYTLLGIFSFLFYRIYRQLSYYQYFNEETMVSLLSLSLSFVGIFFCVFSILLPPKPDHQKAGKRGKTQDKGMTPSLEYEVIATWRGIEGVVSDFAMKSNVKDVSAINFLQQNGLIDVSEYETLKKLLRIRNEIVHSGNQNVTAQDIKDVLKGSNRILDKLKKVL